MPDAFGEMPEFAHFWTVYPSKRGKAEARKAWRRAVTRAGGSRVIIDGAQRFAADPNLPPEQFIPHASRWLNGDRWNDPPLPPRGGQQAQVSSALSGLAAMAAGGSTPELDR